MVSVMAAAQVKVEVLLSEDRGTLIETPNYIINIIGTPPKGTPNLRKPRSGGGVGSSWSCCLQQFAAVAT